MDEGNNQGNYDVSDQVVILNQHSNDSEQIHSTQVSKLSEQQLAHTTSNEQATVDSEDAFDKNKLDPRTSESSNNIDVQDLASLQSDLCSEYTNKTLSNQADNTQEVLSDSKIKLRITSSSDCKSTFQVYGDLANSQTSPLMRKVGDCIDGLSSPKDKAPVDCEQKSCCTTTSNEGIPTNSFSWSNILKVQNLIERCLQQYMSKSEIIVILETQASIEPEFTHIVWQKLEEQNPAFFQAYKIQLQLKDQILIFNELVQQHVALETKDKSTPMDVTSSTYNINGQLPRQSNLIQELSPTQLDSTYEQSLASHFVPSSPLPLPSPVKSELDTHSFFM